jgi:ribosomal protein S18 acetylase RimI-like enzyme
MITSLSLLEWDSNFFGYSVGCLSLVGKSTNEAGRITSQLNTNHDYELIYIYVSPLDMQMCKLLELIGAIDVGSRIKYSLQVADVNTNELTKTAAQISKICPSTEHAERLNELAQMSGVYSRFAIDPHFVSKEYARLYREWVSNNIKGADTIPLYIYTTASQVVGFVSLSHMSADTISIDLLSVDPKYRGKGIATKLLLRALSYARKSLYTTVDVATQSINVPGRRLYEKLGFKQIEETKIYHFWTTKCKK